MESDHNPMWPTPEAERHDSPHQTPSFTSTYGDSGDGFEQPMLPVPSVEEPEAVQPPSKRRGRPKKLPGAPKPKYERKKAAFKPPGADHDAHTLPSAGVKRSRVPALVSIYLFDLADKVDEGMKIDAKLLRQWAGVLQQIAR